MENEKELGERLDATNRIKKTNSSQLAELEHKVIQGLLNSDDAAKGPESMQGWLCSAWWLTGLPQQKGYAEFRESHEEIIRFLTYENILLEKDGRGHSVESGNGNVSFISLSDCELKNLWLKRDYALLLQEQACKSSIDIRSAALIYGEINFPAYGQELTNQQFFYHEQLGLVKNII